MLDDAQVLTEGPAILQYLADLRPKYGLAPENGSLERVRLQEWLNFITTEIHAGSSPLFDKSLPTAVQETVKAKLFRRLDIVEARLADADYLMGERFTVADVYLFTRSHASKRSRRLPNERVRLEARQVCCSGRDAPGRPR
ncbi:hypothetical protein WR25_25486 [Diploscapter pachys]|uniref:GST C-terminal domain-containing protein n=1 Tax=Diploscapter pachys TaxID=2018661 RepID=A0A2A2JXJ8_9BILA|nr:hypothetical protein WR25_25486 [Diploscapter pachys]